MKYILLFTILLIGGTMNAQKVKWMSMNEAIAAQKKQPKKIFVDMYTEWCGPCKMLDKNTFGHPEVAAYINKNFYPVKFNAEGNEVIKTTDREFTNPSYDPAKAKRRNSAHQFTRYMGVNAYPTVLFIDEQGKLINRVRGYKKPQDMEFYLKFFGTDLWEKIKTQPEFDAYLENFKPQFKG